MFSLHDFVVAIIFQNRLRLLTLFDLYHIFVSNLRIQFRLDTIQPLKGIIYGSL